MQIRNPGGFSEATPPVPEVMDAAADSTSAESSAQGKGRRRRRRAAHAQQQAPGGSPLWKGHGPGLVACTPLTRIMALLPLLAVFVLALLMGFAARVLLNPDPNAPLQLQTGALGGFSAALGGVAGASGPHRRRLIQQQAAALPFRVNPLAGQLPRSQQFAGAALAADPAAQAGSIAQRGIGAPVARGITLLDGGQQGAPGGGGAGDVASDVALPGESAPGVDPEAAARLGRRMTPGPAMAPGASFGNTSASAAAPSEGAPSSAAVRVAESQIRPVRDAEGALLPLDQRLRVCLMSADFHGLPNPGPIATAFHLLAGALAADPSLEVRMSHLSLAAPAGLVL